METLRCFRADNPGPFTLDGTRTFIVGREHAAVVDPGPDLEPHVQAVASAVSEARSVTLVLTHGHPDHAEATEALLDLLPQASVTGTGHPFAQAVPSDGIRTDAGSLHLVPTPGHTADHIALYWSETRALFAGDHLMGEGDTTWVAGYPGCVADYLASLERLRALELDLIYPTHGPVITDPKAAVDRYEAHRMGRIAAAREARRLHPGGSLEELVAVVYGETVPAGLFDAACASLAAVLEYVDTEGDGGVSSRS